ncbi:MAG: SAM hydroxide adenosyltransferase, partial [Pseudomonadota bacterium]
LPKEQLVGWNWPSQLAEVIYIDGFGNAFTGIRGDELDTGLHLVVSGRSIGHAPTFEAVAAGTPFWYVNSCGLVEVAVNGGSAAHVLGLVAGTAVKLIEG